MSRRPTDVISKVPALNDIVRNDFNDKVVNKESVNTIFKKVGLPFNDSIWSILKENRSVLIKLYKRGEYKFVDTPIYWAVIKEVYEKYRSIRRDKNHKYSKKNIEEKPLEIVEEEHIEVINPPTEDLTSKINKAIIFLVNHGYSVWQPGLTYCNR